MTQNSGAMKYMTLISALGTIAALILTFALPKSLVVEAFERLEKYVFV